MKKRTIEDRKTELEHIHDESLRIVRVLATAFPGTEEWFKAQRDAQKLMKVLEQRERTDRCYYCGSKRELGIERDTGLTRCFPCVKYEP